MTHLRSSVILVCLFTLSLFAQQDRPKLAVVIVCDQLSEELLLRYQPYFSDNGFNLLMKRGANFANARFQYAFTKTGPGHAAISTGAYGDMTGIVGNSWYVRSQKKTVNCVGDTSVQLIGRKGEGRSPRTLLTYTIGDMLKLSTNFRSKVISVSNKDRAAIFLSGKFGTAYWTDSASFITSTYYMQTLPPWVTSFNNSGIFTSYFGKKWELMKPDIARVVCDTDSNAYESDNVGMGGTFPHLITGKDRTTITDSYYWALETSPFATELLLEFARKTMIAESLGTRGVTDMLCIGISATDVIGHEYGPHSYEVFDNLLRTDAALGAFFSFLDEQIGLYNCAIALTADHAIAPIPEYIIKKDHNADAGRIGTKRVKEVAERSLTNVYGTGSAKWIESVAENGIYVNKETAKEKSAPFDDVLQTLKDSLMASLPVFAVFTQADIETNDSPNRLREQVKLAFYHPLSGDLMYVLKPYWILDGSPTGTNHGSPWDYDAHVPLLFFGKNVTPGTYYDEAAPVDLAPTLAALLGIEFPPSREGKVLQEILR